MLFQLDNAYCRHLGSVNTITFVDDNRRFVTTSDDKSLRVWEWDTPVDMKYIAEPNMHSMPFVTLHPNGEGKWRGMTKGFPRPTMWVVCWSQGYNVVKVTQSYC